MNFLEKFNELTDNKYDYIRLQSVGIGNKPPRVEVELLVPYDILDVKLTAEDKQKIEETVRMIVPKSMTVAVSYVKSYIDANIVKKYVLEYFKSKHPTIIIDDDEVKVIIDNNVANIEITMKSLFYDFFQSHDITESITEYMSHKFCNDITVTIVDSKEDLDVDDFADEESITIVARQVRTSDHEVIYGKMITARPKYIIDCGEVEDKVAYCGEVVDFKRMQSKKSGFSYYVISICDGTGTLVCKAFTKYSGEGIYDTINIGDEIIVFGNVAIDTFLHTSVLMIKDVNRCVIDKTSIILKEELKSEPVSYTCVIPEQYNTDMVVNSDLFSTSEVVVCPESMLGKTYVVFDFETTGLDPKDCDAIELAAVKVVDGIITETFSTFVDPGYPIPKEVQELTNISDSDVMGAPSMDKVVPDFYKFTRGSIMVAHNASFDKSFLDKYAKPNRYLFDNKLLDTLAIARKTVVLPKYKLVNLCEHFGVSLEGAHRAVNDCEATAKVLIELAKLGGLNK